MTTAESTSKMLGGIVGVVLGPTWGPMFLLCVEDLAEASSSNLRLTQQKMESPFWARLLLGVGVCAYRLRSASQPSSF